MTVWYDNGRGGWCAKFTLRGRQRWVKGGPWATQEEAEQAERGYRQLLEDRSVLAQERRTNAEKQPHTVYRLYTGDTLLYVGLTGTAFRRTAEHRRLRDWWPLVDRAEFEHYPNYRQAAERESELIRELRPAQNRRGLRRSLRSTEAA